MLYHLTPESINENLTPTPNQLQNVTYKTRYNCFAFIFFFTGFIFSSIMIISSIFHYISQKDKTVIIIFLLAVIWILIFTCIGGYWQNYYISFNINTSLGIIKVKTIKIYCCFNKIKKILINDLQKVLIQRDNSNKGSTINGIEVVFVLNNESEIKGGSGIINYNNESNEIYNFLRNSLPENIPIEISKNLKEINCDKNNKC